uniref:Uncharacterized protein n=1 Tax=Steinernema glaseri TaxID=37863 RepID=A0A1I7ZX08_9BILA
MTSGIDTDGDGNTSQQMRTGSCPWLGAFELLPGPLGLGPGDRICFVVGRKGVLPSRSLDVRLTSFLLFHDHNTLLYGLPFAWLSWSL